MPPICNWPSGRAYRWQRWTPIREKRRPPKVLFPWMRRDPSSPRQGRCYRGRDYRARVAQTESEFKTGRKEGGSQGKKPQFPGVATEPRGVDHEGTPPARWTTTKWRKVGVRRFASTGAAETSRTSEISRTWPKLNTYSVCILESMADALRLDWDQANTQHIVSHRVTPEEVEQVFSRYRSA